MYSIGSEYNPTVCFCRHVNEYSGAALENWEDKFPDQERKKSEEKREILPYIWDLIKCSSIISCINSK
jgi:hypothetical protein